MHTKNLKIKMRGHMAQFLNQYDIGHIGRYSLKFFPFALEEDLTPTFHWFVLIKV